MLTISRLANWLLRGDRREPLCARIERAYCDRRPCAVLAWIIVNINNPLHSARVLREHMERDK